MKRRVYTDTVAAGIAAIDSEMTAWIEVVSSEEGRQADASAVSAALDWIRYQQERSLAAKSTGS